ncbi:response regulator [Polaribacter reichenbachii]|uniref:Transcriptional regulator n=1 Tax=Polaribacter reichenbachii TaxID=996801 RepID=A0A1B8U4G6_9FLAO|nr:response regulator [Polaribacter reichenbachii]APZ47489.1 response regulator [Polaribacter reichenbachii]AUC18128.1 response regulator [Polaribacter reichenbachii]OBY66739.1 transcriptional regulator [Polaribacter reichenbachii]
MHKSKLKILLVEDNQIEVIKLKRSISKELQNYVLTIAGNGFEALECVDVDVPDMILLDLNMPDMNGIEFLTIIKQKENLRHIPVIILTTSSNNDDISECYALGIAGYILKPLKFEDYELKIKTIMNYWNFNEFLKL